MDICENVVAFEKSRLRSSDSYREMEADYMAILDSAESVARSLASQPVNIDHLELLAVEVLVSLREDECYISWGYSQNPDDCLV